MLKLSIAWLVLPIMYVIWGLVLIIHPPKRNEYVGYRSQRSKQSTDHWAYAQKLSGLWLCVFGLLLSGGVGILLFFIELETLSVNLVVGVLAVEMIPMAIIYGLVEHRLKRFKVSFKDKIDPDDIL